MVFVIRSRELLRTEFLKNKDEVRSEYLEKMYKDADEVDEMLRFHLVQGHRETPEGNFGNNYLPYMITRLQVHTYALS